MTELQLSKFGIFKVNKNRYWCNSINGYLIITKNMSGQEILDNISKVSFELGKIEGKEKRSEEIRDYLREIIGI